MEELGSLTGEKVIDEKYILGNLIQRTKFSVVYESYNPSYNEKLAIKIIPHTPDTKKMVENEVFVMSQLDCPNITPIYQVSDENFGPEKNITCTLIVMPYAPQDLYSKVYESGNIPLSERVVCQIMFSCLTALREMHEINIVHRDIKLENFLVFNTDRSASNVKLTDFGLAVRLEEGEMLCVPVGTRTYWAPELYAKREYDFKVDMWAIGVVFYQLLTFGIYPFRYDNSDLLEYDIMHANYDDDCEEWDEISQEAKDLLAGLLTVDPRKRLSAEEALNSPWIKKFFPEYQKNREAVYVSTIVTQLLTEANIYNDSPDFDEEELVEDEGEFEEDDFDEWD